MTEGACVTVTDRVARFATAPVTPGSAVSARSTRPVQEAQVIPSTDSRVDSSAAG